MQPGYPGSGQDPYNQQPPSDPFGAPGYGQYPPQQPDPYAQPQPDPYAQPPQYGAPASGAPYQDPYAPGYPQQPVSGAQPYDPYNPGGQQYYQQPQSAPPAYPQAPAYQAPVVYPGATGYTVPGQPTGQSNTLGLLSMIFGIVSIVLGFCCGLFGTPFAIAALVMGFIGLNKVKLGQASNKGMALAGVICGGAGLVVAIIMVIVGVAINNGSLFGTTY